MTKKKGNLYVLLKGLMSNRIDQDEYTQLKTEINTHSDLEMKSVFQSLWNEIPTSQMPSEQKMEVWNQLEAKNRRNIFQLPWLKLAMSILIPLICIGGTIWLYPILSGENKSMKVLTEAGQKSQLILTDGTKVWLNAQSSIQCISQVGSDKQIVKLEGEAYFEVEPNQARKFIVETDRINVIVEGTRFNVTAHPNSTSVDIFLMEGSVSVEDKLHTQLATLTPNQAMHFDKKSLTWNITTEDAELASLWRLNKCRFESASAEEVFDKLEYWYGMKIDVKNINTEYRYSFTVQNETMRELLELINELTPLNYQINGEEVKVWYK